ncbi:MAG: ABC transporter permease [Rhodospirillales bacterium]|jgi:spermidine/putrescine transport system permease protein|nr:ABC transporter permease [Rhodospirillales bacterium]MBT4039831.1 ABC transporter permease [Rhodospirillales bacterium]MBT4625977.1 ABC transporter permease [Rhodospirillales bacterium]MBT5350591.1 ABC transporter permease [Rhodospirillales bacterium]MBT5520319.1 ABC transporter permease [Rhodospirillales bacterium]
MPAWIKNAPAAAYLIAALVFIYLPVVVLVVFSFQDGLLPVPPFNGPSLQWYEKMFANERLMDSLLNSVVVAISSALVTTVLGFLAAYGMARRKPRFAGSIRFVLMAPLTVSYLIIGIGLLITLNIVGIPKSLFAVGIGHVVINLPLCFAIIYSQFGDHLRNIDWAARDLGAGDFHTLTRVIAPIMKPSLFASFCLSATLSWDEFIIAFLLSRFEVTMPVIIFEMLRAGLTPEVNAAGTMVFAISMVTVGIAAVVMVLNYGVKK